MNIKNIEQLGVDASNKLSHQVWQLLIIGHGCKSGYNMEIYYFIW